jgi:hypothetical protein
MAINASRVVVGGLAAGVVGNIVGFLLFGMWLGPRMEAEAVAVAPSLQGRGMTGSAIALHVMTSLGVGLLLVWLYAAMRPRFGPGPKTAMYAAFAVWLCGLFFHIDGLITGMMTPVTYVLASLAGAAQSVAAAWVGAMLYREDGATR